MASGGIRDFDEEVLKTFKNPNVFTTEKKTGEALKWSNNLKGLDEEGNKLDSGLNLRKINDRIKRIERNGLEEFSEAYQQWKKSDYRGGELFSTDSYDPVELQREYQRLQSFAQLEGQTVTEINKLNRQALINASKTGSLKNGNNYVDDDILNLTESDISKMTNKEVTEKLRSAKLRSSNYWETVEKVSQNLGVPKSDVIQKFDEYLEQEGQEVLAESYDDLLDKFSEYVEYN